MRALLLKPAATVGLFALTFLLTVSADAPLSRPALVHLTPQLLQNAFAPSNRMHAKLVSALQNASGKTTVLAVVPAATPKIVETPIDVGAALSAQSETSASLAQAQKAAACAAGTIGPQIFSAKGELTSNGYLVIQGACFGSSGTVSVTGPFPSGSLGVTMEAWTSTAITVQLPAVSGVPNLMMFIEVKRAGGHTSAKFSADFTAAIGGPLPLLNHVAQNVCDGTASLCIPTPTAVGSHADLQQQSGTDVWTYTVPPGWRADSVQIVRLSAGPTAAAVVNASSTGITLKIAWSEAVNSYTTVAVQTQSQSSSGSSWDSIFADAVTGGAAAAFNNGTSTTTSTTLVDVPIYSEAYRLVFFVRGPLGMVPPM